MPEETVAPKGKRNFKGKNDRKDRAPRKEASDLDKKVVEVRRVTKVVKGGRTLRFSALVVVGDKKGKVGLGIGKSKDVTSAIDKATTIARRNMKLIPIVDGTIPHETTGKYSATNILLLPAPEGTGVIAGGSARAVIELAGIRNIVTKKHGSSNKINVVKATMEGLLSLKTKEEIARRRGKSVEEI
ncbi:MAG: 30S ribosomal protein S5 [Clostridia bacterium]|nr:30S ribosomal protein S5 [Clostridia bacterium]MBQ8792926.1 30S ribosomal protein S5 [Clostridia bacterium]